MPISFTCQCHCPTQLHMHVQALPRLSTAAQTRSDFLSGARGLTWLHTGSTRPWAAGACAGTAAARRRRGTAAARTRWAACPSQWAASSATGRSPGPSGVARSRTCRRVGCPPCTANSRGRQHEPWASKASPGPGRISLGLCNAAWCNEAIHVLLRSSGGCTAERVSRSGQREWLWRPSMQQAPGMLAQ